MDDEVVNDWLDGDKLLHLLYLIQVLFQDWLENSAATLEELLIKYAE